MREPGRYLIVNADDFGLSEGVNRGILRAHDHGIVTSASLMVRQAAAASAVEQAGRRPRLSLGLHLDLGEWEFRDGNWVTVYQVVPATDAAAVAEEVERQLNTFVRLVGRNPTHVDSHQHVHRTEPTHSPARQLAAQLNIPLRHFAPGVAYRGDFYAQGGKGEPLPELITPGALKETIRSLADGVTELGCHPGDAAPLQSAYRDERRIEVATLCDPEIRVLLSEQNVGLISFLEI